MHFEAHLALEVGEHRLDHQPDDAYARSLPLELNDFVWEGACRSETEAKSNWEHHDSYVCCLWFEAPLKFSSSCQQRINKPFRPNKLL